MPWISSFSPKEVDCLFKTAKLVVRDPGVTILMAPKTKPHARILIVTPRRIGNAPQRNLMRRRFRSLFYEEKMTEQDYDTVVFVKKSGVALPFEQLKILLLGAQERAKKLEMNASCAK